MNLLVTPHPVTPDDLLRRPDGNRFELVNGRLVEVPVSAWSSFIAGVVFGLLRDFLRPRHLGWLFPEGTAYQCFPTAPSQVRKPDVSVILRDRYPADRLRQEGHIRVAPDLAVEVISPNDLIVDLNLKLLEYLDAGIPLIWVIDPQARIVWVLHRGSVRLLCGTDELTGEDVLPGFRCTVAQLFIDATDPLPSGASQP
jgi:Uma2 family endonuclease